MSKAPYRQRSHLQPGYAVNQSDKAVRDHKGVGGSSDGVGKLVAQLNKVAVEPASCYLRHTIGSSDGCLEK